MTTASIDASSPRHRLLRYLHDDLYKDYLLEEVFTTKQLQSIDGQPPALTLKGIYDYAHDVKRAVRLFYEINTPKTRVLAPKKKFL